MLRAFGSDLTSLINSDPAWKVSKGSRSSSRRARKIASKNLKNCVGHLCSGSEDLNMQVTESEKRGVSTLGCHFSEKAEHVPIKKRRFLLRSPSPPPAVNAPPAMETSELTKCPDVSSKVGARKSGCSDSIDVAKSDHCNGRFGEDEDFSGISILAAAACSSSLGRECGYAEDGSGVEESSALERAREVFTNTAGLSSKGLVKEDLLNSSEMSTGGSSSCISTEPVGELVSISTAVNLQNAGAVGTGMKGSSLGADSVTFSGNTSCNRDEEMTGSQRQSSRDDRLHWDLNVVMDAWEEPLDSLDEQNVVTDDISEDAGKNNAGEKTGSDKHDPRDELPTACAVRGTPKALTNEAAGKKENGNIDQHVGLGDKSLSSSSNFNLNVAKCSVEDMKCTIQDTVNNVSGGVVMTSDHATQSPGSGAVNEADTSVKSLKLNSDEHHIDQPVLQDFNSRIGVSSGDLENLKTVCGAHATCDNVEMDTSISFHVSSSSDNLREVMPNSQDVHVTNSDREGLPHSVCAEAPNVTSTCELLIALDTKRQDLDINQDGNSVYNSETMMNLSEIPAVASRSSRDSHNVGVSCHPNSAVGPDAAVEHQEGYDSQYEDGELRESNEHAWEEYDDVDREAEQVDYGSDVIETCMVNPTDHQDSESGQVEDRKDGIPGVAATVSAADCTIDDGIYGKAVKAIIGDRRPNEDSKIEASRSTEEKMHVSRAKELLEGTKSSSDMATGVVDDDRMATHADGLVDSKDAETRTEEKPLRRGLQSRVEVSRDGSYKERLNRAENRFESGSFRSFERGRCSFQYQPRGRQGDNWDGSSDNRRGCKRHYSPIFPRRSKPDDATVERDDIGCDGTQDGGSYTHQLQQNSRPGADEEPGVGFQPRYRPDRKFSPDRTGGYGRGRSFRYGSLVDNRAGRGRFNGPSPDESFQSSLKYRRPLSHRERSLSPFGGRGQSNVHHSRRKSPSRSRSRSPIMWPSPRGRPGAGRGGNTFIRHRSKSPNFRMQRLRSPNHQPGFGADHAMEFRSIQRNHSSPPRNRWNSGRKDELGHFREFGYKQRTTALERSPGRINLRGDRDSVIDSPRNLKPDGYCRISDVGVGRGHRYQENYEDRRKPYNFLRPARRSYEDGMSSRMHQENDDSFPVANNIRDRDSSGFRGRGGFRGIDSRIGDPPRRFRGEQSFMYDRDGKFNSNSKQFGVDAMDSSRYLKTEDQYRPPHMGRFTDMDGTNRARRYDNYEDRRRHYGPSNIMRRNDEGMEERCNRNDENFQDASEFSGRSTRGFDSRIVNLSTRSRDNDEPVVCGQEEKLDDNSQTVGVQNPKDSDAARATIAS